MISLYVELKITIMMIIMKKKRRIKKKDVLH